MRVIVVTITIPKIANQIKKFLNALEFMSLRLNIK
jgi:hypothetical protein